MSVTVDSMGLPHIFKLISRHSNIHIYIYRSNCARIPHLPVFMKKKGGQTKGSLDGRKKVGEECRKGVNAFSCER